MVHISPWKSFAVLGVCLLGLFFASPNYLPDGMKQHLPEWMLPVNLGLDLQGGSQLLLEVDLKAGLKDQVSGMVDSVRSSLRSEKIGYVKLMARGETIAFTLRDPEDRQAALGLLRRDHRDMEISITPEDQITLKYTEQAREERIQSMIKQSIEMVRRRVDEYGTTEPNIQKQGDDGILVQLPGVDDPARVRELLGQTAKMTFRLVHPQSHVLIAEGRLPPGHVRMPGDREGVDYIVEKQILLSGENLVNASPSFDQFGRPSVNFKFDTFGGRRFGDITTKNVKRQLAIVLDNKVISAPVISGPIPGGQGEITGNFTVQETNDLSILMRAGALPAPLTVIEERTVGPDLGADSIAAGEQATVLAVILVGIFMLLSYSFFGVTANVALFFNLILLFAYMSITQATLTLPGIAGIALTIGMAVDANVLIYERIKEELRAGRKIMAALDAGYKRAMATIIDSNLTTLIGSVLLYIFGTGPIKGFAVTLSMGILISMFTAISLTRIIALYWLRWRRPKKLSI